jgi:hypothetical protein
MEALGISESFSSGKKPILFRKAISFFGKNIRWLKKASSTKSRSAFWENKNSLLLKPKPLKER